MSKLFIDEIQKTGGPTLTLPNVGAYGTQYLKADTSGNLMWASGPSASQVSPISLTPAGSSPMLFCRFNNFTNANHSGQGFTYTTELGTWHNTAAAGETILGVITGRNTASRNYLTQFETPTRLVYITGSRGEFSYMRHEGQLYQESSSMYNYPDRLLGVVFIKNTTASPLTRTFYFAGASYYNSGYEGASAFTLVPNATNTQITANTSAITSFTNTLAYTRAADGNFTGSFSATIPADTTIAIVYHTSVRYLTNSGGYIFDAFFNPYDVFTTSLTTGLIVDIERTNRALYNPLKTSNLYDIWK